MVWLALGLLALVLALLALRAFAAAEPRQLRGVLVWGGGAAVLGLAGLLLATGRGGQLFWALTLLGPLAWRWWQRRRFAAPPGGGPGASEVETASLAMALDHASGRMTGRVKQGRFAGRDLAGMDLPELLALHAELAAGDAESLPLLEAWLDRAHPDWRSSAPPPSGEMSRAAAFALLGLAEGASADEIRAAHRRLMRDAHPDHGGSDQGAARLNAARDLLLGG